MQNAREKLIVALSNFIKQGAKDEIKGLILKNKSTHVEDWSDGHNGTREIEMSTALLEDIALTLMDREERLKLTIFDSNGNQLLTKTAHASFKKVVDGFKYEEG